MLASTLHAASSAIVHRVRQFCGVLEVVCSHLEYRVVWVRLDL